MSLGQRRTKKAPALCRVPSYCVPGLPSPTMSRMADKVQLVLAAVSGIVCRRCVGIAVAANLVAFVSQRLRRLLWCREAQ